MSYTSKLRNLDAYRNGETARLLGLPREPNPYKALGWVRSQEAWFLGYDEMKPVQEQAAAPERDHWGEDPTHSVDQWKWEVEEDNTRLGYWAWVDAQVELED